MNRETPKHCRSCNKLIYWLLNASTGKPAPIDVATYADGNVQIDLGAGTWWVVEPRGQQTMFGPVALHKNHFATCPDAPRWKSR